MGLKLTCLRGGAPLLACSDEQVVEAPGLIGWCGIVPGRAAAFPAITVQGELGDDEQLTLDIGQRQVHLALVIIKNTQVMHFIHQPVDVCFIILAMDTKEDNQTRGNSAGGRPFNVDLGGVDPLEYCSHKASEYKGAFWLEKKYACMVVFCARHVHGGSGCRAPVKYWVMATAAKAAVSPRRMRDPRENVENWC